MTCTYVDGYNVVMSDPATRELDAGAQRAALVRRLGARGRDLLGAGAIVVVWDGRSDGHGAPSGPLTERYAGDDSADDVIARLVQAGDTVVTNDHALADAVRGKGASVKAATALFEAASPARRRRARRTPANVGLPPGANRITEELKGLWLPDEE